MSLTRFAPAPLLAVAVALSSAAAQDSTSCTCTTVQPSKPPSEFELRSSGTITFIQSRPQGGLGANIPRGYGVDGAYFFRLDQRGNREHVPLVQNRRDGKSNRSMRHASQHL